jgi:plasmid stabilization system protein ParE
MNEYVVCYRWERRTTADFDQLIEYVKSEGTSEVESITKLLLGKYEVKYVATFYYARRALD